MTDQLLTVHPVRAVNCGHIVIRPGEHVRGTRFSIRAPHSASCNQCKKEPAHD